MATSVLLAYATRYGSTEQVAHVVAETLRARGIGVEVQPAKAVRSVDGFETVILGTPLYYLRLQKGARRFLARHGGDLSKRQFAAFVIGPTSSPADDAEWKSARDVFEKELARIPSLKPMVVEVFGGKFDPTSLRFPDNLFRLLPASPIHSAPASDIRDWAAIRTWAGELAGALQRDEAA